MFAEQDTGDYTATSYTRTVRQTPISLAGDSNPLIWSAEDNDKVEYKFRPFSEDGDT